MDYEFQEFQSLFQSVLDIGGFLFTVFILMFVYSIYYFIIREDSYNDSYVEHIVKITLFLVIISIGYKGLESLELVNPKKDFEDLKVSIEKYEEKYIKKTNDIKEEIAIVEEVKPKEENQIIITEKDVNLENNGNLNMTVINGPVILSTQDNKIKKCKKIEDIFHCE